MKNPAPIHPCKIDHADRPAAAKALKSPASRKAEIAARAPRALLEDQHPHSSARVVAFQYDNLTAGEVFVAGTFNDWQPRATPLTRLSGGRWSTELTLAPDTYEYLLVVDGHWQEDPSAVRSSPNPFGGRNSVVDVNPAKA